MGGVQQAVNTTGGLGKPCLSEPWRGKVSRTVCPEDLKLSLGIALSGQHIPHYGLHAFGWRLDT